MTSYVWFCSRSVAFRVVLPVTMGLLDSPTNIERKTWFVVWSTGRSETCIMDGSESSHQKSEFVEHRNGKNLPVLRSMFHKDPQVISASRLATDVVEMSFSFFPTRVRQTKSFSIPSINCNIYNLEGFLLPLVLAQDFLMLPSCYFRIDELDRSSF